MQHKVNHDAETIEGGTGLPFRVFVRHVPRVDPVHEQLLILSFVCELLAVFAAHIFAASAKPHRLSSEALLLLRREVPSIQIMLPPYFVIAIITHHHRPLKSRNELLKCTLPNFDTSWVEKNGT